MKKLQIGVIGSAGWEEYPNNKPNKKIYELAYETGQLIAQENAVLICGGKGGIMEEACRGAKEKGGITAGIISGNIRNQTNKYVDVEVVSGATNCGEESIIISMCDAVIAIGGGSGTLQEIATAYRNRKPIVVLKGSGGWSNKVAGKYLDERELVKIELADSPKEALELILEKLNI